MLGALTIAPVGLAVLWVFGIMAVRGISFGRFTAMIRDIAIDIGVPYTIRITHRYEETGSATTPQKKRSDLRQPTPAVHSPPRRSLSPSSPASSSSPPLLVVWDRWHLRCGHAAVDKTLLHTLDIDELMPD